MKTFQCNRMMLSKVFALLGTGAINECITLVKESITDGHDQIGLLPILQKLKRTRNNTYGFSLNEIATIGNQIEYAGVTSTAVQNWVKRDIKDLIGPPLHGKKYSIDQAVIILIVEDLKMVLDFDSIRKILTLVFNNLADRHDDLIDPVSFYGGYANIFEKLISSAHKDNPTDQWIKNEALLFIENHCTLQLEEKEIIQNVMVLAVHSVHASVYKLKAQHYLQTTLQIRN